MVVNSDKIPTNVGKTYVIGDVHGRNKWRVLKNHIDTKFIFIGDYWDGSVNYYAQYANMLDILAFKAVNPDNVTLLLGNHDMYYLNGFIHGSGYQKHFAREINELMEKYLHLFKVVHKETLLGKEFLFSHAGVTKTWLHVNSLKLDDLNLDIADNIEYFNFVQGRDEYGDHHLNSPVWVRPRSLEYDSIDGYTQVVGHTQQKTIKVGDRFIYVDSPDEFLVISDKIEVKEYTTFGYK